MSLSYCLPGGSGRSGSLIHPRVVINGRVPHFYLGGHAMSCGRRKSGPYERVDERRLPQAGLSFTLKEVETNEMSLHPCAPTLIRLRDSTGRRQTEVSVNRRPLHRMCSVEWTPRSVYTRAVGRTWDRWQKIGFRDLFIAIKASSNERTALPSSEIYAYSVAPHQDTFDFTRSPHQSSLCFDKSQRHLLLSTRAV